MTANIPHPESPNPRFERKSWVNINGEWQFQIDSGDTDLDRKLYESKSLESRIIVPFCPEKL